MSSLDASELSHKRHELKLQGRFAEAIPVQLQILEFAQQTGRICNIANAWNMLSHFYQLNGQLSEAEAAGRNALSVYDDEANPRLEALATYEMKLATILAAQERFDDAVHYGNLAVEHYSDLHDPPDDFLRCIKEEVALMAQYATRPSS